MIRFSIQITARLVGFLVCALLPPSAAAQRPVELAPNAPRDRPASIAEQCQWDALVQTLEPYAQRARATYPTAKQRFLAGLPSRESFFVTVRLSDSLAHHEQVFVVVDSIVGNRIAGRIWSNIELVRGFRLRQPYSTRETDIVDWLISKPDGTEDGNVVGKFLDTYQPPTVCRSPDATGEA